MFSSLVAGAREPWYGAPLPVLHSQEQETEHHHPQSKRPQQRKRTGYRFVRKGGRREGSDYSLPLSCSHCFCVQLTELSPVPRPHPVHVRRRNLVSQVQILGLADLLVLTSALVQ